MYHTKIHITTGGNGCVIADPEWHFSPVGCMAFILPFFVPLPILPHAPYRYLKNVIKLVILFQE